MPDGGREAVNVELCPVCGATNIAGRKWCYGMAKRHTKARYEWVEVVPVSEVDRLTRELMEMESRYHLQRGRRGEAEQRAERAERALREAKRDFEFTLADIRRRLAGDDSIDAPFDEDLANAAYRCEAQIDALTALPPTAQQPREERER